MIRQRRVPLVLIVTLLMQSTVGFLLFPVQYAHASGTIYYVDNMLTDSHIASATPDCTTYNPVTFTCGTGSASAYTTIADINAMSFNPGDQILFRGGQIFRGSVTVPSSGTAGNPITYGSFGSGQATIDPSTAVTSWTVTSGTVWQASVTSGIRAVVVNGTPLKEVSHGQTSGVAWDSPLVPTSSTGKWFFSTSTNILYADMGTTLGAGNPNSADIIVMSTTTNQTAITSWNKNYITLNNLTIRGASSQGVLLYGTNNTVQNCVVAFNGKQGIFFDGNSGITETDNAVIGSIVHDNFLQNWPRGNNNIGHGTSWGQGVSFGYNLRPVVRGSTVYMNGGEGIGTFGTKSGLTTGSGLFEQNLVYDNWSMNVYVDNQPTTTIRYNFIFDHPMDMTQLFYGGWPNSFNYDLSAEGIGLSDEQTSSDSTNNYANQAYAQVYGNIIANTHLGIYDYAEGVTTVQYHGLKNASIVNNTIILPYATFATPSTGIEIQDNYTPSGVNRNVGSTIANNIVYGFNSGDYVFVSRQGSAGGGLTGVTVNNNSYYSLAASPFGFGPVPTAYSFANWKANATGLDTNSVFADPLFSDVTQFRGSTTTAPVYNPTYATVAASSPSIDAGLNLGSPFNLALNSTSAWPTSVTTLDQGSYGLGWDIGAFVFTDTTAPTVSVTSPASGATVSGSSVAFAASASDNTSVAGVRFKLDTNTNIGSEDTTAPYSTTWDSTSVSDGSHSILAVARDGYGNYATSTPVTFTVKNTPTPVNNGGGSVVGLIGTVGTFKGAGSGYVAPRPQIIYPDGRIVYLDASSTGSTPSTSSGQTSAPQVPSNASGQAPSGSASYTFTTSHKLYDTGSDILKLQQYLNTHGFTIATTGVGSPGHETNYFGAATFKALKKFQVAHGLPASGYFGPLTRAVMQ